MKVLLSNDWIKECYKGGYGSPIVIVVKSRKETVDDIEDFIWRMCVSYWKLNQVTLPFQYYIGHCDDAVENLGEGVGILYFIIVDCAQGYHQIQVWSCDKHKLAFFVPDGKKYTFKVLPFGPVNASHFYTAIIQWFQLEWTHLFQLLCNNTLYDITVNAMLPVPHVATLPRECEKSKFTTAHFLSEVVVDTEFVLAPGKHNISPPIADTYTNSTIVHQRTLDRKRELITGSRTIIDDIMLWSNSSLSILLLFECVYRMLVKHSVSLEVKECSFFKDQFDYVGQDSTPIGNTTSKSKYMLVEQWARLETGEILHSFISFCNFYARYVPMFQLRCKPLWDLYLRCGKTKIPHTAWTPQLIQIFENLKADITSSPLLGRYDNTKPVFLKTNWSATGMGYIILQPYIV